MVKKWKIKHDIVIAVTLIRDDHSTWFINQKNAVSFKSFVAVNR